MVLTELIQPGGSNSAAFSASNLVRQLRGRAVLLFWYDLTVTRLTRCGCCSQTHFEELDMAPWEC